MPAQILQETSPGLVLVQFPDGRTSELPLDMAQQAVQRSYGEVGPPADTSFVNEQGLPPPPPGLPTETVVPQPAPIEPVPQAAPEPALGEPTPALLPTPTAPAGPVPQRASGFTPPPLPDERPVLGMQNQALQLQAQGAQQELQAGLGLASEEGRAAEERRRFQLEESERNQRATVAAEQSRAEYEAGIQQALAKVSTVNPSRVWQNAGNFGSAAGLISAAVGGYLSVIQGGGPNQGLQMIQHLIDQDIQSQKVDIETQREAVYRAENAYERNERSLADQSRRMEEERAFRLQALIEDSKKRAALFQSPIMQAKYSQVIGQLVDRQAEHLRNASDINYKRQYQQWSDLLTAAQRQQQLAIERMNAQTNRAEAETRRRALKKKDPDAIMVDPDTRETIHFEQNVALTPGDRSKIIERQATRRSIGQSAKDYLEAVQRIGRGYQGVGSGTRLGSEDQTFLRAAHKDLVSKLVKARSGAAFTAEELKTYEEMIGKPPGLVGQMPDKKIERFLRSLGDDESAEFNQIRASKDDGQPYNPYDFYLDIPKYEAPGSTSVNQLRESVLGGGPADAIGAVNSLSGLAKVPGQIEALRQNFPDLGDEIDLNMLRNASEAKAAGDLNMTRRILDARKEFLDAWMSRSRVSGPQPGDDNRQEDVVDDPFRYIP